MQHMKKLKKAIGMLLMASPLLIIVAEEYQDNGWRACGITVLGIIAIMAVIWLGSWLMNSAADEKDTELYFILDADYSIIDITSSLDRVIDCLAGRTGCHMCKVHAGAMYDVRLKEQRANADSTE